MAEPTTTTTVIAWAAATSAMGVFLTSIGVSWPIVFWATLGTLFGASWAPKMGRAKAMAAFPASSLLAAKIGILASGSFFAGAEGMSGGIAAAAGLVFHPAIALVVAALPQLANRFLSITPPDQKP